LYVYCGGSGVFFKKRFLVAGPGFAPGPSDYEPDEVLFLHPASKKYTPKCVGIITNGKIYVKIALRFLEE
jgi:hypothetical protein